MVYSKGVNNRDKECYAEMLLDDAVIGSINPLIDSISAPELILKAPCDPELQEYLDLFMTLSGIGNIRKELIGEALVYGAAAITYDWRVIHGGHCHGWAVPVQMDCLAGANVSFLTSSDGRVGGVRSNRQEVGCNVFIYKNSLLASDHCGRSILEAVRPLWKLKHEVYDDFNRWRRLFSDPALVGTTGPDAEVVVECNEDGDIINTIDPVKTLYDELQEYTGGSTFAVPYGYTIEMIQPEGKADMYLNIIEALDIKIARVITSQSLATHSTGANSRAAAEVHADMIALAAQSHMKCYKRNVLNMVIAGVERSFCNEDGMIEPKYDIPHRVSKIRSTWRIDDGMIDDEECTEETWAVYPTNKFSNLDGESTDDVQNFTP